MKTNYMVGFFWKDKVENQLTPEELHKWEIERAYREGFYAGAAGSEAFAVQEDHNRAKLITQGPKKFYCLNPEVANEYRR